MMVVDASISLAWVLPGEATTATEKVLEGVAEHGAVAPALWPTEVLNALVVAERRRRFGDNDLAEALRALSDLPIEIATTRLATEGGHVAALARRHQLSAYDAAYLELALRLALPLATLDEDLVRAAKAEDVRVVDGGA